MHAAGCSGSTWRWKEASRRIDRDGGSGEMLADGCGAALLHNIPGGSHPPGLFLFCIFFVFFTPPSFVEPASVSPTKKKTIPSLARLHPHLSLILRLERKEDLNILNSARWDLVLLIPCYPSGRDARDPRSARWNGRLKERERKRRIVGCNERNKKRRQILELKDKDK